MPETETEERLIPRKGEPNKLSFFFLQEVTILMIDKIISFGIFALFIIMCALTMIFVIASGIFLLIAGFIFGENNYKKIQESCSTTVDDMIWYAVSVMGRLIRAFYRQQQVQNIIFLLEKIFRDNNLDDTSKKMVCVLWHELVKPGKDQ